MNKEILIESIMGQTRLALLEDGRLAEAYYERAGQEKLAGNIYAGRVENVLPGMNAAFVDIGLEKNAFLYAGDISLDMREDGELKARMESQRIEKMLRRGQSVLVQVVKEPGGTKGPRVSGFVTLPGRLMVLLPTVKYVGVSKKIEDEAERSRLKAMAEGLCGSDGVGMIVRTAARDASEAELAREFEAMIRLWRAIETRGSHIKPPALIHMDDSLPYRAVRDMLDQDTVAVRTESAEVLGYLKAICRLLAPEYEDRMLLHTGDVPLFDLHGVDTEIDRALGRKVWLKSGGYLVFDETEALTVVDVNTGKFVGKSSLSETVFKTNCEAAVEIARQLRLRDVGGIVIADFIDMDAPEQREQLLEALREALKGDRNRANVVGITSLGLVEMTRKKVRQPLSRQLLHACEVCGGTGLAPSYETTARRILREMLRRREQGALMATAHPGVAAALVELGAPEGVTAYALGSNAMRPQDYEIELADPSALPKGAHPIKHGSSAGERHEG